MKFKVGDKVRVREDLEKDTMYGAYEFIKEMAHLKGEIVTIKEVFKSCYRIEEEHYMWTDEMLEEVQEKTFREVIADIKEGEVWESNEKIITLKNDKIIFQVKEGHEKIVRGSEKMMFSLNKKYKLQRKQYSFDEAFKAYEEGEEIEDYTGTKYKKIDGMDHYKSRCSDKYCTKAEEYDYWFGFDEVRNPWYINN